MSNYETYVSARGGIYVPPRRSSALIAPEDFAQFTSRNEDWKKIQQIVISLFQKKSVRGHEILSVSKNLNAIIDSPGGKFLKEYYNDILLIRGIVILREPLRALKGAKLIQEMNATWKYFFSEILPSLSAIFYKIESKSMPIRKLTLKAFKDLLVFKLPHLLMAFKSEKRAVESDVDLRQMLLMLQTATDKSAPDLRLQELLTYVVKPYLCQAGLFMGPGEPVIRPLSSTEEEVPLRKKHFEGEEAPKTSAKAQHQTERPISVLVTRASPDLSHTSPSHARRSVAVFPVSGEAPSPPSHARQKSLPDFPLRNPIEATSKISTGSTSSILNGIPAIQIVWTQSASGQLQRDVHAVPQHPPLPPTIDAFVAPAITSTATAAAGDTPLCVRPKSMQGGRSGRRESVPRASIPGETSSNPNQLDGGSKIHSSGSSVGRKALSNAALDTLIECGSGDELSLKEQHFV